MLPCRLTRTLRAPLCGTGVLAAAAGGSAACVPPMTTLPLRLTCTPRALRRVGVLRACSDGLPRPSIDETSLLERCVAPYGSMLESSSSMTLYLFFFEEPP